MKIKDRLIIERSENLGSWFLDGSVTSMICTLNELEDKYGGDAYLSVENRRGYYDEYYPEVILAYKSIETDKEYNERLAQHERIKVNKKELKVKKKEDELKEYNRLKAKYEKVVVSWKTVD